MTTHQYILSPTQGLVRLVLLAGTVLVQLPPVDYLPLVPATLLRLLPQYALIVHLVALRPLVVWC